MEFFFDSEGHGRGTQGEESEDTPDDVVGQTAATSESVDGPQKETTGKVDGEEEKSRKVDGE